MTEPIYEHDCDECIFLGTESVHDMNPDDYTHTKFDMYAHERDFSVEYIARFSSDGPDYICTPSGCNIVHPAIRLCQLLYDIYKLKQPHPVTINAPKKLEYTKDIPTEPGYYWMKKQDGRITLELVFKPLKSDELCIRSTVLSHTMNNHQDYTCRQYLAEWAGPLTPPEAE